MVSERKEKSLAKIEFHPDWQGEIPALLNPSEINERASKIAQGRGLTPQEYEELLSFLLESHERFFWVGNNNRSFQYHRPCGGGAVRRIGAGLSCSRCKDEMEEVIPPDFLV